MMIVPPRIAQEDGCSPMNRKTQTGLRSGSIKPIILASSGRVPPETPLIKRIYAIPIWMMPSHYVKQFHPRSAYDNFVEFVKPRLFEGVVEHLTALRKSGTTLVLVSSSPGLVIEPLALFALTHDGEPVM